MYTNIQFEGDADVREFAETHQGQATLPDNRTLFILDSNVVRRWNASVDIPPENGLPFSNPEWMPTLEEIYEFAEIGGCGVIEGREGNFKVFKCGGSAPMQLVPVRFLILPLERLEGLESIQLFEPREDGKVLVPFIGDIWIAGEKLGDEILKECGVEWLLDDNGVKVQYLALMMGRRSVFFPTRKGLGLECPEEAPVGFQFKGIGVPRYAFHTLLPEKEMERLGSEDLILRGSDTDTCPHGIVVQRPSYAGRAGILLDLPHQPISLTPVGGQNGEYSQGIGNQKAFVLTGKRLCQVATLLNRTNLVNACRAGEAMSIPDLFVTCEVWQGTTLRLDTVTQFSRMSTSIAQAAARTIFESLVVMEYGRDDTEGKIRALITQMGKNVASALNAGLTLYVDRNSDDNITWEGLPLDFGDYHKASGWWQMGSLVLRNLNDIQYLLKAAGYEDDAFFSTPFAQTFLGEFLPKEVVDEVVEIGCSLLGNVTVAQTTEYIFPASVWSCIAAAYWAKQKLRIGIRAGSLRKRTVENYLREQDETLSGIAARAPSFKTSDTLLAYALMAMLNSLVLADYPEKWEKSPPVSPKR